MNRRSIFEFDVLAAETSDAAGLDGVHGVPAPVYAWLEAQCERIADAEEGRWLRLAQRRGRRVVQVTSFVGVIRTPQGFQIEVLPKLAKVVEGGQDEARQLLIRMLCCLDAFRHVHTARASILAAHMPLQEVFITEFLRAVDHVVKRGVRGDYQDRRDHVFALRGKLLVAEQVRHNLHRADRFFTEHDEFSSNRPENRLLHAALKMALALSSSGANQRWLRELLLVFADIPLSVDPRADFQRVRPARGMAHYEEALDWARLILDDQSPLTGEGGHRAPSLLFPMEAVFEAFVARQLSRQLRRPLQLRTQARSHHLVRHRDQDWFQLRPDLLVLDASRAMLVLDTKWKLLDASKADGKRKYGLSQSDFHQLQAYGQSYLDGTGDVVLIYPKSNAFDSALPVFDFPKSPRLRLWVLPFCLTCWRLRVPGDAPFAGYVESVRDDDARLACCG